MVLGEKHGTNYLPYTNYERKIIPSYNETLRACFTVVKSKFFYFFSYEFSCEFF